MNKAELVSAMAEKTALSKKDAEAALKAFTDIVAEELKKVRKSSQLDLVLSKYLKELKEQEETHRAVKRWLFQLLKHLSSKQEKL